MSLGILWQRRELTQYHDHWSRHGRPRPKYLEKAAADWGNAKATFNARKEAGFPGSEPLQ